LEKNLGDSRERAIDNSNHQQDEKILNDLNHLKQPSTKKTLKIKKKTLILYLITIIALSIIIFSNIERDLEPSAAGIFESPQQFLEQGPLIEEPKIDRPLAEENENLEKYESILLEEAQRQNLVVEDVQVEQIIEEGLAQYGISDDDLNNYLEQNQLSMNEFKEQMKEAIAINQLISENVDLASVTVTDEEVDSYIDDNSLRFQDILADDDASEIFRDQTKFQLLAQKQTDLVMDYISTLQ